MELKLFKKVVCDIEFGVVRGIDFKNVCIVVNYDMFEIVVGYIYCIGWIGCVGNVGIFFFFVFFEDEEILK